MKYLSIIKKEGINSLKSSRALNILKNLWSFQEPPLTFAH